jgi:hypothetical protein
MSRHSFYSVSHRLRVVASDVNSCDFGRGLLVLRGSSWSSSTSPTEAAYATFPRRIFREGKVDTEHASADHHTAQYSGLLE